MTLLPILRDAVKAALADAKNPAVLLSGGVDSSTVATLAGKDVPAFTGYYDGAAYDEREYARLVGKDRKHTEVHITPADFVAEFDAMRKACGDALLPVGPGVFGQWMVAKAVAAAGHDVVLTGEGGDELFGGYARLIRLAGGRVPDGYENYEPPADYPNVLYLAIEYDWQRLPLLVAADDAANGSHGLRTVAPMLSASVVKWAQEQPADRRVGKALLKDAVRGIVPDKILDRTDKRGFPVPFVEWAQDDPARSFVEKRIGYTPDPGKPWDRGWWQAMLTGSKAVAPTRKAA